MSESFSFDAQAHLYRLGKRLIPSVTNVLRITGISRDLRMVRPDVLEAKRQIGIALHRCLHFLQERDLDPTSIDDQLQPYLSAYRLFVKQHGFKQESVELHLAPTLLGMPYGMTLDVTGLIRGEPWLIDFKTSTGNPDYGWSIQVAAYAHGMGPPLIPPFYYRRASLQLLSSGKYKFKEWTDPGDLEEFQWALAIVWRRINRGEKPWIDK